MLIITPWIRVGGADILCIHLANELSRPGCEVLIATIFVDPKDLPSQLKRLKFVTPAKSIAWLCQRSRFLFLTLTPFFLNHF